MPPEPNLDTPPKRPPREEQSERLRHWRHLLGDEHFLFFLGYGKQKLMNPAHEAALDEGVGGKARRRSLARYHMAKELLELVTSEEKTLADLLERKPK